MKDTAELWMGSRKSTKGEMAGIRLCQETHKMMLQIQAEQIFDGLDEYLQPPSSSFSGKLCINQKKYNEVKQKYCGDKK